MKTKTKLLLSIVAFSMMLMQAKAQYESGFGIRFGNPGRGLTLIKYFAPGQQGAANFIVCSQFKGLCATGLYEIHTKNKNYQRIEVANVGGYFGGGIHLGSYRSLRYDADGGLDRRIIAAGLDGIIGIEWKLPHVPLLLSADLKPFIDITNGNLKQPQWIDGAVSLRYMF